MKAQNSASSQTVNAVVAVPVAPAWMGASAARFEDAPVTQPLPDMAAWMAALTHDLRLDLLGRIATSALLGEPVIVVSERNGWSEVRLPWQPTPSDPLGYPAWILSAHLAPSSAGNACEVGDEDPAASGSNGEPSVFCVTRRLVPVRATRSGPPVDVLSLGTRLPVVDVDPATGTNHAQVQVAGSRGTYWIDADCGIYAASAAPKNVHSQLELGGGKPKEEAALQHAGELSNRSAGIIAAGSELLGLSYLWGGLSGWGVDCSGLVHLAHRALGFVVPRDSVDQHGVFGSVRGAPVVGQPVFFRYQTDSLRIHHVGLAVSETVMLHAPKTGRVVEFHPIGTEPYGSELEAEPGDQA